MTDIVLVALVSAGGATLVGVASALASIFGPTWREAKQREAERAAALEDARFEATREFVESLGKFSVATYIDDTREIFVSRDRFVSTLRKGEGEAARFAAQAIERVRKAPDADLKRLHEASAAGDMLYEWLRGERDAVDLRFDIP